jgi:hypothetical protein
MPRPAAAVQWTRSHGCRRATTQQKGKAVGCKPVLCPAATTRLTAAGAKTKPERPQQNTTTSQPRGSATHPDATRRNAWVSEQCLELAKTAQKATKRDLTAGNIPSTASAAHASRWCVETGTTSKRARWARLRSTKRKSKERPRGAEAARPFKMPRSETYPS